jgi:hypothetical protein
MLIVMIDLTESMKHNFGTKINQLKMFNCLSQNCVSILFLIFPEQSVQEIPYHFKPESNVCQDLHEEPILNTLIPLC